MKQKIKTNGGAAMLIMVVFFLFISLAIISGLVSPSVREVQSVAENLNSKKSYFLSESGAEDAMYRILAGKNIGTSETITLDSNTTTTNITTTVNQKEIISLGSVKNFQRKVDMILQEGAGVGFNYGIQSGNGGFILDGGSKIIGNVYSNGNIQANNKITGTAIAAGGASFIGDNANPNDPVTIGTSGVGDAWAYKVVGANVAGNLYCQVKANTNKVCNTSKGIPPAIDMPFTDENINEWKAEGTAGGIITGATNCHGGYSGGNCHVDWANATFGPGKITGNLVVDGGGTLTLTGTIYVMGTITVSGGGSIKLPSNFNQYSATIVTDGQVVLSGGSYTGSGAPGSYLFVVTTNTCSGSSSGCGLSGSNNNALTVTAGSGAIAVCAQSGKVALSGGITINSATGKTISVTGGSTVSYDQGLASPEFQSGPSGGWGLAGWKETN